MKNPIKMYIWAIKESYSYMKGARGLYFWVTLPFKAFWITMKSMKY